MKQLIQTEHAPQPTGPYSQAVRIGNLIFVSGQDGVQPNGETAGDSIAQQTKASLVNISNILAEAGGSISDVVYMTCHLTELTEKNVAEFNRVYDSYFKEVKVKPARITVGSQLLGTKVEISAIAKVN